VRVAISNSKVLVVEDSKFLRIATERILSRAGYQVIGAADGEQALQIAQDELPDIILLDMLLPKLSGQDVLKALKANPATQHIPVIILTSMSQKNAEKLLSDGAAAYFEKGSLEIDTGTGRLASTVQAVLTQARSAKKTHS
jgi:CheY-like chemotaxis protein